MRRTLLISCIAISYTAFGQQKELSLNQIFKNEASVTKASNRFVNWIDDSHYEGFNSATKTNEKVDVITGNTGQFIAADENSVYIKDNDIYMDKDGNNAIRLTQTADTDQNPTLSPDEKTVAFTRNGNLYILDISSKTEKKLTNDGAETVYNGYASWVYMEEILTRSSHYRAFWWSDDSKHIAFMHFDDSEVPLHQLYNSEGHQGFLEKTRYPKAGDKNPKVKIGVVDIDGKQTVWADFDENTDQYFGQPHWAPDGKLWITWMPRRQNIMNVYAMDIATGKKTQVYHEEQKTWIDIDDLDKFTFLKNQKNYLVLSDQDGWKHIYLYDLKGNLVRQVTKGDWQVSAIEYIDEENQKIYFTARKEASTQTDFYVIDFKGTQLKKLSDGNYTNSVSVSPNGKYFNMVSSNISTPTFSRLFDIQGKLIRQIGNSKSVDFDKYDLAKSEMITIPTADGWNLPALITYPLHFDKNKTYPVVFKIYGGPNAGTVKNTWKGLSDQWWAKEGIITIEVDHRASGQFGKKGVDFDFKSLGKYDIDDYIEAAKWLKKQTWVAKDKLLITGHSYGGYVTCMALTKGADYFDFGYAGAPVTSWDLYDTSYTERFMTTPQDNPEGYLQGSVLHYVDKYKGLLRIAHGDMDDNVHIQNTFQLIDALQKTGKYFEMMVYPGSRHGFQMYQNKFDRKERAAFYYTHLLNKPIPAEVLEAQ